MTSETRGNPDGIGPRGSIQKGIRVPREVMLASAGTGKTFHLSSRVLGLLAAGAPPESILATTFTRKAAGEILDRILIRLARAVVVDAGLAEFNEHAVLAGGAPLDREDAGRLLSGLAGAMHRIQVSTLDSFFHRVARAFSMELGLVPGWSVADEVASAAVVDGAITRMFERLGDDELRELLRLLHPGEVRRRVHDEILEVVGDLQRMVRDLDPSVEDPWGFEGPLEEPVSHSELEALVARLAGLEAPTNKNGKPNQRWVKARNALAESLPERNWQEIYKKTLPQSVLPEAAGEFCGIPVPPAWMSVLSDVATIARRDLALRLQAQMSARGRLARAFEEAYREVQMRRGVYRFDDIPHLLLEGGDVGMGDALYYRLDGRIRHLLLDEFQDTSVLQWRALEPLAGELFSGHERDRAGVVVADPKQSIYGWRGAEPALVESLRERYALPVGRLSKSWRTASPILDAVNRIFGGVADSAALTEEESRVAAEWARTFTDHEAAYPDRSGYVRVVAGPPSNHERKVRPPLYRVAVAEVADIRTAAPSASIGVLCRTRAGVTRMTFELKRADIPVSEEGGGPLGDAWGVQLMLSGLMVADRSGDRIARYLVAGSPLGEALDLMDWTSDSSADRMSARVRSRLFSEGYGMVLNRWVSILGPHLPERDRVRMDQLVELAFRHDEDGGSLRPLDFVKRARKSRVESPGEAAVRVMTVHASKGLEFDAVVLPEMEWTWGSRRSRKGSFALPVRETPEGPLRRVLPNVPSALRSLFPEVEAAAREARASQFRDDLSTLYVALTRPRYGLHIVTETGREEKATPARLVCEGLGVDPAGKARLSNDRILLLEEGNARWMDQLRSTPGDPPSDTAAPPPARVEFDGGRRSRGLPRKSPSDLQGMGEAGVRVEDLLNPAGAAARRRGTVAHAWLEAIEWLEVETPDDATLLEIASRVAPGWDGAEGLVPLFKIWLEEASLQAVLSRERFAAGTLAVRELPFLLRDDEVLLSGRVDRVLVTPGEDGRPKEALVVDFKTDAAADTPRALSHDERFRSQMEAYRKAVSHRYRLPMDRVDGRFVVLRNAAT